MEQIFRVLKGGEAWTHKRTLFLLINIVFLIQLSALLWEVFYLRDSSVPSEHLRSFKMLNITTLQYKSILNTSYGERIRDIQKVVFRAVYSNLVVAVNLPSWAISAIEFRFLTSGMRSALFHTIWSIFTILSYEYLDVRLFSTWYLTITDSGVLELNIYNGRNHLWTLFLLTCWSVIYFIAGYLVAILSKRWSSYIFPLVTLLIFVQLGFQVYREPNQLRASTVSIPPGPLYDSLLDVCKRTSFPIDNIKFKYGGRPGAALSFGFGDNIVLLSGPTFSYFEPSEWAALAATQIANWSYGDPYKRMAIRLSIRLAWGFIALKMISSPGLYDCFAFNPDYLVVAFGVTEIFAANFDELLLFGSKILFWTWETRTDWFAANQAQISKDTLRKVLGLISVNNRIPLDNTWVYQILIKGKNSAISRSRNL